MDTIISIYEKIEIKEITFETGDNTVHAKCDILANGQRISTEMLISHTDLNRIIAKISADGYDFQIDQMNLLEFEDGTQIFDYSFENVFGEAIVLENFQFSQAVKQIRA